MFAYASVHVRENRATVELTTSGSGASAIPPASDAIVSVRVMPYYLDPAYEIPPLVLRWLNDLPKLEQLELTELRNVPLDRIPPRLTKLRLLDTTYRADDLPAVTAALRNIDTLSETRGQPLLSATVCLPALRELVVVVYRDHVSAGIYDHPRLEMLGLTVGTPRLPPGIGKLAQLTTLAVTAEGDDTFEVPSEIGRLTQLTSLSLKSTNVLGLPDDLFRSLSRLRYLSLCGHTRRLPPGIHNLTRLRNLSLVGLVATDGVLPRSVFRLTNLYTITLPRYMPAVDQRAVLTLCAYNTVTRRPTMASHLMLVLCEARRQRRLPPELHRLVHQRIEDLVRPRWKPFPPDALTDPRFFDGMPSLYP